MVEAPIHSKEELEAQRLVAIENFRRERMEEPLEEYLTAFEHYLGTTEELLESTVDLAHLEGQALGIITNKEHFYALRYLAGPPISLDDLVTLASITSLAPKKLSADPATVKRIVQTIQIGLDRKRFPWISEGREPTEGERQGAVLATAALMAAARVSADRRNAGKDAQETKVEEQLLRAGLTKVPTRTIYTHADAPNAGEFCRESLLVYRKADFVVRLYDSRILAIECKVSNSSTNSIKRLNNDIAAKAEDWLGQLGSQGVVPAGVIGGVYKLKNLVAAQERGLALFWGHDLAALTDWIDSTK